MAKIAMMLPFNGRVVGCLVAATLLALLIETGVAQSGSNAAAQCRQGTDAIVPARMEVRKCEQQHCAAGVSAIGDGGECYKKCTAQVQQFFDVMIGTLEKCGEVPSGACSLVEPMKDVCNTDELCVRLKTAIEKYCRDE